MSSNRRLEPKNEEVLRRRIGKCLNDIGWDVVQSMISTATTNLRMVVDTLLLALQYLDHGHTIHMTFMPGNSFFDVAQHYPERRVLFLSHFLSQGRMHCVIVMEMLTDGRMRRMRPCAFPVWSVIVILKYECLLPCPQMHYFDERSQLLCLSFI